MRVEWDLAGFAIDMGEFAKHFQPIADRFGMKWRVALFQLPSEDRDSSSRVTIIASSICFIASVAGNWLAKFR